MDAEEEVVVEVPVIFRFLNCLKKSNRFPCIDAPGVASIPRRALLNYTLCPDLQVRNALKSALLGCDPCATELCPH